MPAEVGSVSTFVFTDDTGQPVACLDIMRSGKWGVIRTCCESQNLSAEDLVRLAEFLRDDGVTT